MSELPQRFLESWPQAAWNGRQILVAASGGADSTALVRLLVDAVSPGFKSRICLVHVNHALRGQQSEQDQQFVEQLAQQHGLACRTRNLVPQQLESQKGGLGLEAAARSQRYQFFEEVARELSARYLVTAHHRDDQVETAFHRILRGTGISGLKGMATAREWMPGVGLVRPLLPFTRQEIMTYLNSIGQPWREDASNASSDFTRNKIRNQLLPLLREEFGSQVDQSLWRLTQQAAECQAVIDDLIDDLYQTSVEMANEGPIRIDLRKLKSVRPYLIQELMVRIWIEQNWSRQEMTQTHWQKLSDLVWSETEDVSDVLPGNIHARSDGDFLILDRQQ